MTNDEAIEALLKIKALADNKTICYSNQGQTLDGYSELANYRLILSKLEGES